jgi:hypothetical protein
MLMVSSIFAPIITASDVLISIKKATPNIRETEISLNSKSRMRQPCFRIAAAHP